MNTPKFSIVIPVYNVAPYLRECLDSLCSQKYRDWEAICVDDGSSDGSGRILDEYGEKDVRFRVFHTPNRGVSRARNLALSEACGEWLCFLDSDDRVEEEWLSHTMDAMTEVPDVRWIRTGYTDWYNGRVGGKLIRVSPTAGFFDEINYERAATNSLSMYGMMVLNFFKREDIAELRFDEKLKMREDCLFGLQTICRFSSYLQIGATDYWYRIRSDSASRGAHQINMENALLFMCKLGRFKGHPEMVQGLTNLTYKNLRFCLLHGAALTLKERCSLGCAVISLWRKGVVSLRALTFASRIRVVLFALTYSRKLFLLERY